VVGRKHLRENTGFSPLPRWRRHLWWVSALDVRPLRGSPLPPEHSKIGRGADRERPIRGADVLHPYARGVRWSGADPGCVAPVHPQASALCGPTSLVPRLSFSRGCIRRPVSEHGPLAISPRRPNARSWSRSRCGLMSRSRCVSFCARTSLYRFPSPPATQAQRRCSRAPSVSCAPGSLALTPLCGPRYPTSVSPLGCVREESIEHITCRRRSRPRRCPLVGPRDARNHHPAPAARCRLGRTGALHHRPSVHQARFLCCPRRARSRRRGCFTRRAPSARVLLDRARLASAPVARSGWLGLLSATASPSAASRT
jgi:hypothetical protein